MTTYRRKDTGEIRELGDDTIAGLPPEKRALWEEYVPAPVSVSENDIWLEKLEAGYLDPVTGIKLKTTVEAKDWFTAQMAGLTRAERRGAIDDDSPITFWDYNGQEHTVSFVQFDMLMLRYMAYYAGLFSAFKP